MLLEGGSGERVLKSARRFAKEGKTAEGKAALIRELRNEVTLNAKEMMSEDQLSSFVDELTEKL